MDESDLVSDVASLCNCETWQARTAVDLILTAAALHVKRSFEGAAYEGIEKAIADEILTMIDCERG